jgi:spermidine synthase
MPATGATEALAKEQPEVQGVRSPERVGTHWKTKFFGLTIFVGAFLLFQVQLILGKYILPWFGGTPSVWTTCLLFFQILLLAGYAYAHFLAMKLSPAKQRVLHTSLLGISILLLIVLAFYWPSPITPGANWKPQDDSHPIGVILSFLLAGIGLPFLLVSATGPLLQHWFAESNPGASPYRLYSLSNLGSLLGLISYPFLIEPHLRLHTQAWMWSASYGIYVVLCLFCAPWWSLGSGNTANETKLVANVGRSPRPGVPTQMLWMILAACGSVMLLATTNVLCQQVAVIPFLWVAPLVVYLLSFILCFESTRWYRREIFQPVFAIAAGIALILAMDTNATIWPQLFAYPAVLFACCMVCHGEIALTKPAPEHLTLFYLWISVGGALGGGLVSLVAPRVFSGLWEFPLDILVVGGLILALARRDQQSWWQRSFVWMPGVVVALGLLMVPRIAAALELRSQFFSYACCGPIAVALAGCAVAVGRYASTQRVAWSYGQFATRAGALLALLILGVASWVGVQVSLGDVVARSRNFYGVLAVLRWHSQLGDYLTLRDRMVDHGLQFLDLRLAREPAGYYGIYSGISLVLHDHPARPMRIGVIGLGTGEIAAFAKPGDVVRYYEINPDVIRYSQGSGAYFTYLQNCEGKVELAEGDARLSLEHEAERGQLQQFDVLVLDAFSGDAIPVHLLTREAFQVYLKHLRSKNSILALHVTNRSLDLSGEVALLARESHLSLARIYRPWLPTFSAKTDWILLSRDAESLNTPQIKAASSDVPWRSDLPVWTDDFSNLLSVLR